MGRGPGRVQRAIESAFQVEADNAFTTEELCRRVYGLKHNALITKKQRVAVLRAAKNILGLQYMPAMNLGGQLIFYRPLNLKSYAMAQLKSRSEDYRNNDPRYKWRLITEAELRARLYQRPWKEFIRKGWLVVVGRRAC
jgi:hypothetical protein